MTRRPCSLADSRIGVGSECSRARGRGPCVPPRTAGLRMAPGLSVLVCTLRVAPAIANFISGLKTERM